MKFLDRAKIYLKSGDGGPGCLSFRREKYIEFGGPDGGNGGKGGDIIFECVPTLNTLIDFRYTQHFKAKSGQGGMGKNRTGAKGEDLIIKVPLGTQVLDQEEETVLDDFTQAGQKRVFLKGGDGGFGNAHYKSATNQAPRKTTPGWPGQEMEVWLRLKLIADVGIIGLPNAGKSTFLAACSNAKPKVADYPFTTLHPNLGVIKAGGTDFVMADIPGLIEGAHLGQGLGHRFLGHIERTSILLHFIDICSETITEDYQTVRKELKLYDPDLEKKKEFIVLSKCDALPEEEINQKIAILECISDQKIYPVSSVAQKGINPLLSALAKEIKSKNK